MELDHVNENELLKEFIILQIIRRWTYHTQQIWYKDTILLAKR